MFVIKGNLLFFKVAKRGYGNQRLRQRRRRWRSSAGVWSGYLNCKWFGMEMEMEAQFWQISQFELIVRIESDYNSSVRATV